MSSQSVANATHRADSMRARAPATLARDCVRSSLSRDMLSLSNLLSIFSNSSTDLREYLTRKRSISQPNEHVAIALTSPTAPRCHRRQKSSIPRRAGAPCKPTVREREKQRASKACASFYQSCLACCCGRCCRTSAWRDRAASCSPSRHLSELWSRRTHKSATALTVLLVRVDLSLLHVLLQSLATLTCCERIRSTSVSEPGARACQRIVC